MGMNFRVDSYKLSDHINMAKKTEERLRIADILLHEMEQPTKTQCNLSRWLSFFKRRRRRIYHDKGETSIVGVSEMKQGWSDVESRSFNLGLACGLLCAVAAGQNEVSKLVELRSQMELFLRKAKQESGTSSKPVDSSTCFSTNFGQASTSSSSSSSSSSSGTQFSLQSKSNCTGNEIATDVRGMDQLEAELHAELERLLLQLDSENNPQQPMLEEIGYEGDSASTDYSDEMLWGCGVSPLELERKLHLVLEARQEERIKELEDALQCAQQKLEEKEIEISWWRDTA